MNKLFARISGAARAVKFIDGSGNKQTVLLLKTHKDGFKCWSHFMKIGGMYFELIDKSAHPTDAVLINAARRALVCKEYI